MNHPDRRTLRLIDAAGVSAALALLAAAYFAGVGPYLRAQAAAISDRAALLRAQHDERTLLGDQQRLRREIDAATRELSAGAFTLRPQRDLNNILDTVIAKAKAHGLTAASIEPGAAASVRHYLVTPVSLRGSGRYPDVSRFLGAINREHPDVHVTAVRLSAGADPASPPPSFHFDLAWYAVPADSAGAASSSAPRNP